MSHEKRKMDLISRIGIYWFELWVSLILSLLFGLQFHFVQFDWSEICTEVSFTSPELMWTLIMKLPYTKGKFYPQAKSQTGLNSLRVSCKRAVTSWLEVTIKILYRVSGRLLIQSTNFLFRIFPDSHFRNQT